LGFNFHSLADERNGAISKETTDKSKKTTDKKDDQISNKKSSSSMKITKDGIKLQFSRSLL
jgi:hypothetical protein